MTLDLALAALVLVGALAIEWRKAVKLGGTHVSNLAETDYVEPLVARAMALGLPVVATALLLAATGANLPVLPKLALAAFSLVTQGCLASLQILAARVSMPARLYEAARCPEIANAPFAFHFSAPDLKTPEHVAMWRAPMDSVERGWFTILREPAQLPHFRAEALSPALLARSPADLRACMTPELRAVFYANNGQLNRQMIAANSNVTHVQLLHGDSDKPPSYSPLTRNYDQVFVAGQVAIDRYSAHGVDIPRERFRVVGRPQVAAIEPRDRSGAIAKLVYMPTWRGFYEDTQFSSLDRAAQIIERIAARHPSVEIIFKPHPMSYKDPEWRTYQTAIRKALRGSGRFADDAETPFDLYNAADVLITDISSVMIDFLYSGRPLLVIDPPSLAERQLWQFPTLAAAYRVRADLADLDERLALAAGDDPRGAERLAMRTACFGDWGRPVGEAFRDACHALLSPQPAPKTGMER
ncbi:CDP-glycerol glycerophosphotransferase family protein [Salipiger mangrovisoli]|uniref:CDP-glycerol glycerophosphotransferase family protein n=1 Tax=Salipiger mangrovisoli TaxID=2865933 RepID=A0ABR9XAH5_9RHOB|nr:CDP-glycerol glycerophosphotransferase family protein [Salipiger mangrovisoli]MBE9640518.1 CDP-glycerol glycerophosphotransferase family protein [Salipiger mangrovisoli]